METEREMEINLNDETFKKEVLESDLPVLVDFWAPWCGPCIMISPIVKEIAADYQGKLKVCKLNVDEGRNTAIEYEIMSIPTMAVFKDGKIAQKIIGVVPKAELEAKIKPYV
ncbi:MAG: thioredoxin [Candidatus Omnitrophota bacterium]|nr:thioredoxin [Candidatus Omnitrophota bacterium]